MAKLEYEFSVVGVANVERALQSLERRFAAHNANVNRTLGGRAGARRLSGTVASGGRALQTDEQRRHTLAMRNAEREARLRSALEQRNITKQQRAQQVYWERARKNSERLREREARQQIALAEKTFQTRRASIAGRITGGVQGVGGALRGAGAIAGGLVGIGGTALAASAISQAMQLDEMSRRLSIAGRGKGEAGLDSREISKQFTRTGIAKGFAPEAIAEGAAKFVAKTGDLDTALKNQETYATVAQGSGAKVQEVFDAGGDLIKLDLKSIEQMQEAFAILSAQGKKGAFELKAMAGEFPEVLAQAASSGVRGMGGLRDVGAIMQIARSAAGSDSEASTAVNTMFRQLSAKAEDLKSGKALGGKRVDVFKGGDARNGMRLFPEIVEEVLTKSEGNLTQFQDIFDIRGSKAGNPLANAFRDARGKALEGGASRKDANAAGTDAVKKLFSSFRDVNGDYSEVQRDAADAMKSFSVQMEILNTRLKDAISSQVFPELVKLGPELAKLVPYVAQATSALVGFVKWFAEEPYKNLATVIGVAFAAQIGKAIVADAITGGMASLLAAITGIVTGKGAVGAAASTAATTATTVAGAGLAATVGAGLITAAPGVAAIAAKGTRQAVNDEYTRFAPGQTDPHADMPKVGFIDALSQLFSGELTEGMSTAAKQQTAAADKLAAAADKLSVHRPNVGNSPSAVK